MTILFSNVFGVWIFFVKMKGNYCQISTIAMKRLSFQFTAGLDCGIISIIKVAKDWVQV